MIILEPHKVPIQSPEGQAWIREKHARVIATLDAYPTLRGELWPDAEFDRVLQRLLAGTGSLATLGYPAFYIEADMLGGFGIPSDYLKRADEGLDFLVRRAPRRNIQDLIGNLRSGVPAAGIFEVMLAWALVSHFGEGNVEPYPKIAPDSRKTMDFAVTRDGRRVLLEAMILLDDRDWGASKQFAIEHGMPCTVGFGGDEAEMHRLFKACQDKIRQRDVHDPFLLCVNQLANWPRPDNGADVVGKLVASATWSRDSMLVGIAYFCSDHLVCTSFAEARARVLSADPVLLSDCRTALCRLVDPDAVARACANEPAEPKEP